jgi:hypothetical protein
MRIMAFDLSSSTGVAKWHPGLGRPQLRTKKVVGYDYRIEDMVELWRVWLAAEIKEFKPDVVCVEEWLAVIHQSRDDLGHLQRANVNGLAMLRAAALTTMTRWVAKRLGCQVLAPPTPAQWRKHAYGKAVLNSGETWKGKAIARCQYLGWEFETHNDAEAGLILDWAAAQVKCPVPWRDDLLMKKVVA